MIRVVDIVTHAAILSNTPPDRITGPCRLDWLVDLRSAVALIARERTRKSYPTIGRALGNRNHSSVIHLVNRALNMIARRPDFAALVDALREKVEAEPFYVPLPQHLRADYVPPASDADAPTPAVDNNLPVIPRRGKKNRNRFDNSDPIFARGERVDEAAIIDGSKALLKALVA